MEAAGALSPNYGARHMTAPAKRDTQPSTDVALIVGVAPASALVVRGCLRRTACLLASRLETRTNRPCKTWRRRTACADTRAMQASRRPWSCCLRVLFETSGLPRLSCATSTAGFLASLGRG